MTEEIKELLEKLFKDENVNGFIINDEIYNELKNYITNLQKENKRLNSNQNKAIEYIDNHTLFVNGPIIKSILKGSDEK